MITPWDLDTVAAPLDDHNVASLDDHDTVGAVLLEALEHLLLALEHLPVLPGLQDQPDLLLDEPAKLLDCPVGQVPGEGQVGGGNCCVQKIQKKI